MKLNRIATVCGLAAALCLSSTTMFAQDDGGQGRRRGGGDGGGGGGFGGGNFDPAQFQQRMMEGIRDQLGFTNETDWNAVQPLVQKVMDAQRESRAGQGFAGFRGRRGGDDNNRGGGRRFGQEPSPEADALQRAVDANAPAAQIKTAMEKFRTSRKDKQAKLEKAQGDLRQVLTVKQEAQALLMGLLN